MTTNMNRRDFIRGTAWMGAAALAGGCTSPGFGFGEGGRMATYADKPFGRLRVGIVGLGRGQCGVNGFNAIPGCEITAICDLKADRIAKTLEATKKAGRPAPKAYTDGEEEWKRLCDHPNVDLVYNATPWALHVPIALYAMRAGKHVATEVPSAFTVDECWELVETSEKLERHCMQLENCCYGQTEMLALNLCRLGILGDIVHGEGAYIHDLRSSNYHGYYNHWRFRHNRDHKGNQYPTHGLGPICWYMDINRGDCFDYLVSLESDQRNFEAYARASLPEDAWQRASRVQMGDMNTTLVKTNRGRSIMIQHDVSSPRPYSRVNTITGTKGILTDYPYRVGFGEKVGQPVHAFFDDKKANEVRLRYNHPLWQQAGEIAGKMGGHGGMDFMMVLRLAYCLQNGLPLDQNVYDLASWCCLCELTEKSVRGGSIPMSVPDFTRGAWRTTRPIENLTVDLAKMGLA
ncbi:MAG: Gfo/Idh/MocA family oxidoreductase [Kiritimatiellae bacterium]|nr:Gfo/Idh/MocA family oxidoreductase [Kiritimatiellia bacterium]